MISPSGTGRSVTDVGTTGKRGVLFDLDGTVWDSMPGILRSLAHAMREVGIEPPGDDVLVDHIGPPLTVMLSDVGVPGPLIGTARDRYRERYHELGVFECVLFDGAIETLVALRADGWRLATATSKGEVAAKVMLEHFGLTDRFDVFAAASMDASSHSKADVIVRAVAGLTDIGATARWMIGDRRYDIVGGRDAGLATVGVTWGYAPDGELAAAGADHIVTSFEELRNVLGRSPVQ
jgi:phosphoglycolate phosphatase